MHDVIVVEVVENVFICKLAVVVIGVHILCNRFVEIGVKVAQKITALLWSQVQHEDQPAHVEQSDGDENAVKSLRQGSQTIFGIGLKVGKGKHENNDGVDSTPNIC